MNTSPPALEVHDLAKSYGSTRALDGVSISISRGEIFGLLGRNGAGKTSLLECILGLRHADAGSIKIVGVDSLANPTVPKRKLGAVLQSTALQDAITPREALDLFGSFYENPLPTETLLTRFGLLEKSDARFETLSGGQRQRLAIALALVNNPALLLLDEPTAGLDPQIRRELHTLIRQFKAEGRSVLIATHYIEEAQELCDRIAILDNGRIAAAGTPDSLAARAEIMTRIVIRTTSPADRDAIDALPTVLSATAESGGVIVLHTLQPGPAIIDLVHHLETNGNSLLDLQVKRPSLEDYFIQLTGGPA